MSRYYWAVFVWVALVVNSSFADQSPAPSAKDGNIPASSVSPSSATCAETHKSNSNRKTSIATEGKSSALTENIQIYCASQSADKDAQDKKLVWPSILEWLTFMQKLAEVLAWPVVVLVLIKLVMPEIKQLLPFVKKIKIGVIEAEFEQQVVELQQEAKEEFKKEVALTQELDQKQEMIQLAKIDPRSAILRAWREVENSISIALENEGLLPEKNITKYNLTSALSKSKLLKPKEFALYMELKELRNKAAHPGEFNPPLSAALNYVDLAILLIATLTEQTADSVKREDDFDVSRLNDNAIVLMKDKDGVQL